MLNILGKQNISCYKPFQPFNKIYKQKMRSEDFGQSGGVCK